MTDKMVAVGVAVEADDESAAPVGSTQDILYYR